MAELVIGLMLSVATRYDDLGMTYCGRHTSELSTAWVAVPHTQLLDGTYHCGDLLAVWTVGSNGARLTLARVEDAGPLSNFAVRQPDGSLLPIALDIPSSHWPHGDELSAQVMDVYNVTEAAREDKELR
jgi:hypothetical protein